MTDPVLSLQNGTNITDSSFMIDRAFGGFTKKFVIRGQTRATIGAFIDVNLVVCGSETIKTIEKLPMMILIDKESTQKFDKKWLDGIFRFAPSYSICTQAYSLIDPETDKLYDGKTFKIEGDSIQID
jgi:hypothetical protein